MLKSMTGFARCEGALGPVGWNWEVRSVNGRGLDVRARLASGYEAIEPQVRDACKERIARGNIAITLSINRTAGGLELRLNEAALMQVAKAIERTRDLLEVGPPTADGLLAIRGVLEAADLAEEDAPARMEAILRDLGVALDRLIEARGAEGARLAAVIAEHLDEIERLVRKAEASPARDPEAVQARLRESVARLMGEAPQLDETRLYQEAVLLAARADIREELDRLTAHLAAARDLLIDPEPVGRRFEFLAQEFNREANTVCSKAGNTDLLQIGLALKAVIDRLREQVQNIE